MSHVPVAGVKGMEEGEKTGEGDEGEKKDRNEWKIMQFTPVRPPTQFGSSSESK